MRIEALGEIWKSHANGLVYNWGGLCPTICVGAHSGVSPKFLLIDDMQSKSKLNRYVRYIYRKLMGVYGTQKVREEALRIFIIATPERARIKSTGASTLSDRFVDGILALCKEWGIPTKYISEELAVFGTPEDLDRVLMDIMPIRVRIRKLTPLECMRLQAVSDEDAKKMADAGLSNSALYKLAGNSICVAPLEGIFTQLFKQEQDTLF